MPNSLDMLGIVFLALFAVSLISLFLMFLMKKPLAQKVCFYLVAVLGVVSACIGIRISGGGLFPGQLAVGIIAGVVSVASVVLMLAGKNGDKSFRTARIMAAAALVVGIINAVL